MLDGAMEEQPADPSITVLNGKFRRHVVWAGEGGIVQIVKETGQSIQEGETIAQILDLFGNVKSEVLAPASGYVLAYPLILNQAVTTGSSLAFTVEPI